VPGVTVESTCDVVKGVAMVPYGPPLVVERLTLKLPAPGVAFHTSETWPGPGVAASPVGAGGGGTPGVALTSAESALSPPPLGPDPNVEDTT
jgi:hypothetical protein